MILLDTNILLRYANTADPMFAVVDAAINALHNTGEQLSIVPQTIYEFWAVATRPVSANGLGLSVVECQTQVARIRRLCLFLNDLPTLFGEWESLVGTFQCHGRVAYDARLVAAMRTYGLTRILTFNTADFVRYPGLVVLDPASIIAPPSLGATP
ncbi:type II toxin-antitoxin system VapC family toxin [Fimbriiglobus ruber]|uniref:Toxin 1, PIN domain n=1 Tax=Fimbriiglobus ruber TaxID=1908690 RepID=A0A225DEB5_9BACT|nr:type II toxin-antitoxin system VapC family toxin [Fimbriiglobus ruber]OWK39343.1 Toxin 1, PIN domain [Fimbriiglobus ruber]